MVVGPDRPVFLSRAYYSRVAVTTIDDVSERSYSIPAGATQSYVIGFTPVSAFPATDLRLVYDCENGNPALFRPTLNSVRVEATQTAVPVVIALAGTTNNDGVVRVANRFSASAFAIATANVGAAGAITVRPDVGDLELPVGLLICETNPASGQCNQPPAAEVTVSVTELETATFAVFVNATAAIPLLDRNRVFVTVTTPDGAVGEQSVQLTTE